MENLYINKKNRIKYTDLIYQQFILVFVVFIFSGLKSLFTWSKPDLMDGLNFFILLEILAFIEIAVFVSKKHLNSIYFDSENEFLIISKFWAFRSPKKTTLKINELVVSDIKYSPLKSFPIFTYITVKDKKNQIKISSADFGVEDKNIRKIYKKLHTTLAIIQRGDSTKTKSKT